MATGQNGSTLPSDEPILMHWSTVRQVVGRVARRHRLGPDDREEFASTFYLRLVDNDAAIFRKFEGRSSLATYLTTVADRVWLDMRVARWGKWRPTQPARAHGTLGVTLERLMMKDHLTFDEACEHMQTTLGPDASRARLEAIRRDLPLTRRARVISLDHPSQAHIADSLAGHDGSQTSAADRPDLPDTVRRALGRALAALPLDERCLVQMRFREGWTIAHIADRLNIDRKIAYRQFDRIHRKLRASLLSAGLDTDQRTCA